MTPLLYTEFNIYVQQRRVMWEKVLLLEYRTGKEKEGKIVKKKMEDNVGEERYQN